MTTDDGDPTDVVTYVSGLEGRREVASEYEPEADDQPEVTPVATAATRDDAAMSDPTPAQIDAVLAFLSDEGDPPLGSANVRDFFPADEPTPPGPGRDAALAALHAADEAAWAERWDWARRLTQAVLDA